MPRIFTSIFYAAAAFAVALLPLHAQAGVSEAEAKSACQKRISAQVPGAEFPNAQNWGDGEASHYFTWTGNKRVAASNGKSVPASCVLNLETMKLYVTVSGRDLPAVKYTPSRGTPASMR